MNEIIVALVSLSGTIVLALLGLYGARKYNIGPNQDKLITTLNAIQAAQKTQIDQLKETVAKQDEKIQQQDLRIQSLEQELVKTNGALVKLLVEKELLEAQLRARKE